MYLNYFFYELVWVQNLCLDLRNFIVFPMERETATVTSSLGWEESSSLSRLR